MPIGSIGVLGSTPRPRASLLSSGAANFRQLPLLVMIAPPVHVSMMHRPMTVRRLYQQTLALATALRAHELLGLDVGDVFDASCRARRRVRLRVFKRSNDNADTHEVVLPDGLRTKLDRFIGWQRQAGQSVEPDAPLFVSRQRNRLSERQLRYRFKEWQARAGFERSFNFHALRHTACTNFYRATKDIRLTQRFARHASVMSTMRYTHCSDEELVAAVQRLA